MRRTKEQKGITLIALILTIVVLMILAAVAINSITNDGIIGKAESVKNTYTEKVNEEQKMLDYYELVLAGTAWTQNGTTVTRGNVTLKVGDNVKLKKLGETDATTYNSGVSDYETNYQEKDGWMVLGADYGKLLLLSVGSIGDWDGESDIDSICSEFKNADYADYVRALKAEDINRITNYNPETAENGKAYQYGTINEYGATITGGLAENGDWQPINHRGEICGYLPAEYVGSQTEALVGKTCTNNGYSYDLKDYLDYNLCMKLNGDLGTSGSLLNTPFVSGFDQGFGKLIAWGVDDVHAPVGVELIYDSVTTDNVRCVVAISPNVIVDNG